MRKLAVFLLAVAISAAAQVSSSPPDRKVRPAAPPATAIEPGVAASLPQLNQAVESTRLDLAGLRIDRWKADAATKRQAQVNADSIQRNMTTALPAIMDQVRANPSSLGAAFKLYRNVNALYDVISMVTEAAGAFGTREEYQTLSADATNLDNLRRSLADKVEAMAAARDAEIVQWQARARQAAAAAAPAPPKKIVVDDNEPVKKPAKKSTTKTTTAASGQQTPK